MRLVGWIGIGTSKFFDWKRHYGQVNEHNAWVPRDHGLEDGEKQAIIDFYPSHIADGHQRVTTMMMDAGIVAASPGSVYRVLSQAGAPSRWEAKPSKKGKGFVPPPSAHAHWHIDVSTLNLSGTFYYLCGILDVATKCLNSRSGNSVICAAFSMATAAPSCATKSPSRLPSSRSANSIEPMWRSSYSGRWKPFPRPGALFGRTGPCRCRVYPG